MKKIHNILHFLLLLLIFTGCATQHYTDKERTENTKELNKFFERAFEEEVARYPTWQTYLGLKTNYGKLNNETEDYARESLELSKSHLKELKTFPYEGLTKQGQLSYELFKRKVEKEIEGWKWRFHSYPLNQMFGYHSGLPSFMINMHRISNTKEANDYISRLKEFKRVMAELMVHNLKQNKRGIYPPSFVFEKVIDDSQNVITGHPFKGKGESPLYEDFKKKLGELKIKSSVKRSLLKKAEKALENSVGPSFKELISYMEKLKKEHTKAQGAWALPDGEDYYRWRLEVQTTTDMTPEEIHDYGLSEVKRIHTEMRQIMKVVGYKGTLNEFFNYMRESKKFQYPQTKKGREAYLSDARKIIKAMKVKLPEMFHTLPKAELQVKAVEPYREKSAGIAFYQGPSLYGDRPGIYYVNLYKMEDNPKYKMEALAYHEALPGHHMQNAIKTELKDLPKFRRTGGYTAYGEGWGLYSEYLPKEFGFYKDPYSDFGRLSMELWRAARLVTDTGLHDKRWSREHAIAYLKENTPNGHLEIVKGIERYMVMPGQATTYKIGMKKILDLRAYAKEKLGKKFDLGAFHDVILRNGSLPLDILEEEVESWVEKELNS